MISAPVFNLGCKTPQPKLYTLNPKRQPPNPQTLNAKSLISLAVQRRSAWPMSDVRTCLSTTILWVYQVESLGPHKPYTVWFRFRVLCRILRRLQGDARVQTTLAKNTERCTKKIQYRGPKVAFRISLGRVIVQSLVYIICGYFLYAHIDKTMLERSNLDFVMRLQEVGTSISDHSTIC